MYFYCIYLFFYFNICLLTFLNLLLLLFYFSILYWFCHTSTCIHHGCTRVPHPEPPSHLPPHTINPVCETAKQTQVYSTVFWTLWRGVGGGMIWENGIETCVISHKKRITSPGLMQDTGSLGLVHWDEQFTFKTDHYFTFK